MLTVKLFRSAPALNDPHAIVWDIISCERFQIYEHSKCAEVVTYKSIPSKEGISWFLSNETSEHHTQCFVENEHGKTIFKHIVDPLTSPII